MQQRYKDIYRHQSTQADSNFCNTITDSRTCDAAVKLNIALAIYSNQGFSIKGTRGSISNFKAFPSDASAPASRPVHRAALPNRGVVPHSLGASSSPISGPAHQLTAAPSLRVLGHEKAEGGLRVAFQSKRSAAVAMHAEQLGAREHVPGTAAVLDNAGDVGRRAAPAQRLRPHHLGRRLNAVSLPAVAQPAGADRTAQAVDLLLGGTPQALEQLLGAAGPAFGALRLDWTRPVERERERDRSCEL